VTAGLGLRLLPQAFEPIPGNTGVMSGVLGISVTEVILHRPQIGALIGQIVAAEVAEHVRPDAPELRGLVSDPHEKIDGLAGELCQLLGHKQPGRIVLPGGEIALDRAQLIASRRFHQSPGAPAHLAQNGISSSRRVRKVPFSVSEVAPNRYPASYTSLPVPKIFARLVLPWNIGPMRNSC
jgi:cell division ATPase FtsA